MKIEVCFALTVAERIRKRKSQNVRKNKVKNVK